MNDPSELDLDAGFWLTITELAKRKGVTKSTVSEKVRRFEAAGELQTRPGDGKRKLVNLAQYDLAIGAVGDVAREAAAATMAFVAGAEKGSVSGRFRDEQTREKAYSADLKFLELERARGNLIEVAEFDDVASDAAGRIADVIDELPSRTEEITAIASKGEHHVRIALQRIARAQRIAIVNAINEMAATVRRRAQTTAAAVAAPPANLTD